MFRKYNINSFDEWWREPGEKELIIEELKKKKTSPIKEEEVEDTEDSEFEYSDNYYDTDIDSDLPIEQNKADKDTANKQNTVITDFDVLPDEFSFILVNKKGEQVRYTAKKDIQGQPETEKPIEPDETGNETANDYESDEDFSEPEEESKPDFEFKLGQESKKNKFSFEDVLREIEEELDLGDEKKSLNDVGKDEIGDGGADKEVDELEDVVKDNMDEKPDKEDQFTVDEEDVEKMIKKGIEDAMKSGKNTSMMDKDK